MKDGSLLVSVLDMNADEIENIELYIRDNVNSIKMLAQSGEKVDVKYDKNGNVYTLDLTVYPLKPLILYIS